MENKSVSSTSSKMENLCQPANADITVAAQDIAGDIASGGDIENKISVRDILDAVPFYVLLVDSDHYIIEANSAVHTHLGVDRESILGKYCPRVIHGVDHPFEGCPLEESAEKNIPIERELSDSNTGHWVMSAVYPTRAKTESGKKIFLHMVMDITERKQAQEQLKISHEQLRLLSAHLEQVREEEKRQIARDLHDETSQVLSSLYVHLEAAIQTLPEGADKTREILKKAQTLSTTILDEIHKLIHDLRPTVLDKLGLVAAVNSLVDDHLKVAGLKVRLNITGRERRLPPAFEISLFRAIQEAFNNIVKHARARKVEVSIDFKKEAVRVRIKDDGVGFNVQETLKYSGKTGGFGLVGMKERVELMNGTMIIDSGPGKGTEIKIEVHSAGEVING